MPTPDRLITDPAYDDGRLDDLRTAIPHRGLEAWKWSDVSRALSGKPSGISAALTPKFRERGEFDIRPYDVAESAHLGPLIDRFGQDAFALTVPAGEDAGELTVTSLDRGNGAIRITLGEGAKLSLVELHDGEPDSFVNVDLDIRLEAGAELRRLVVQDDAASTVRICTARIHMDSGAKLTQHILATGAALSRFETVVTGQGSGIEVGANGAYLLSDKRHADLTTLIDLRAPDAHIRQSVKGIATDAAKGVFQGKFLVAREAQHTDAEMRHDALMLSERCEVRSKPELEIYADDVACAHGNTIGQLDETALFYMRQRGIPLGEARALLVEAFVGEVFEGVDVGERVSAWLEANA